MKIALYVPSWPPGDSANGIVTYASQLVPALRRVGHEVFVLTPLKTAEDPYTIDLRLFESTPTFWDRLMFRLVPQVGSFNIACSAIASAVSELINRHNVDVLEMEETYGLSFAISRLMLLPVVVRLHGPWFINTQFNDPDENNTLNRHRQKWEERAIRHAQFVTAPSANVLKLVKDHYGIDLTGSRVIPNPLAAAPEGETWNVAACDKDRLLFVGRFDLLKGADLVLRVFAELAGSYPKLTLTFAGPDRGIIQADGTIQRFEDFVGRTFPQWLRSRIAFCGEMKHSDVMSLRLNHFATIVASQHEIMPYSVLEAMSFGCPLVATAVGGIPELIQDNRNGLLVRSKDVNEMISACKTLLDDHALAAHLGRQAWRDCRNHYSPEAVAKQTVAAYGDAIYRFRSDKATV